MNRYAKIIEKAKELDPQGISTAEVQKTGWNTKYPFIVSLRFPQKYHSNPNYNTCVTLVSGMDSETAEEVAGILNGKEVGAND